MDKLERYLDQVCRGIAGPRSLRSHIRRELREHILDAADEYRAAGTSDADALERALFDFGGPEHVRADLQAAHGQRVVAVIIDKAMAWKEKTMKAKWVWTSWVHIALALLIVMEVATVVMAVTFILPKVQQITQDAGARGVGALLPGSQRFVDLLFWLGQNGLWLVLGLTFAWALFEWRVRSENKTLMRLSAMGTAAVVLMALVFASAAVSSVPLAIAAPMLEARDPEPIIADQLSRLDSSISLLDKSVGGGDWNQIRLQAADASRASWRLAHLGAAAPAILSSSEPQKVADLREQLNSTSQCLSDLQNAAWDKDRDRLGIEMQKLHDVYGHVQAATKPSR